MAYIDVELPDGDRGIGSAFHVGEGVFVTARHVVFGNKILEVRVTEPLGLSTLDYFANVEGYPDAETRAAQYDAAFIGSNVSPPLWKHYLPPLSIASGPHFAANSDLDVAVFWVNNMHPATPVLLLGNHWDDWVLRRTWHLSDAIILGYPPIPMSQSPVLVAARAEIHTYVFPRHARALHFILSATPRGGFSGGVAIHEDGYVLGVVTSSMVESGQAPELGFFAVLSIEAIVGCLAQHNLLPELQKKNFDDLHGFDTGSSLKAIGEMTVAHNDRIEEGM
jgi:hypothetical protein